VAAELPHCGRYAAHLWPLTLAICIPSIEVLSKMAFLYGTTTDYILGIDNRKVIVLDGLTDREAAVIQDMVSMLIIEFKSRK